MVTVDYTEERRAAHNASSRRSYAKHHNLINEKRRDNYRKKKNQRHGCRLEPLVRQAARLVEIEVNSGHSHAEFGMLTQDSPKGFANSVYRQYQQTVTVNCPKGYRSLLDNAVLEISAIERSMLQHEYIILNTTGVRKEMRRLRMVLDPVHTLVGWLEEMLLEAMISPAGLKEKYKNGELAFLID
ncbi:uncharacterized protein EV420DRAFT_1474315 [Desarmillaria tabescens]|uniref:Uncharacterized protein n=1 Tax=Armillaria tabescens TaxID=1929756 RepID=A0AA39NJP2_ARMTA|nr:uncharacterized protein EV420DRAFT_1474315 [Desarmillaria tabescens]KAK0466897.1 hypothetical protein EV420DRAFT_1474315 [Desarmillaria tabescens]